MSVMPVARIWPREDRPLTVDDLRRLPDDGNRYELVNGILEVTPAPGRPHQQVATRLSFLLTLAAPAGVDVLSPVGMNLARDHHRIPDIAVVRSEPPGEDDDAYVESPPLLAVEVASRSTQKLDRTTKKAEYAAFGIRSYWLVTTDRALPTLTAYELRRGRYHDVGVVAGENEFRTELPFSVGVAPALLVADSHRWTEALRRLTQ